MLLCGEILSGGPMLPRSTSSNPVVLSYYTMRRMVGLIALTLPLGLAAGSILTALLGPAHQLPHPLLQRSISDYYYTSMRDYYVGSLFAIAAFLACSRGYDLHDEITGYLAGACVLGVAVCPSFNPRGTYYTSQDFAFGFLHTVFAALMYLFLSYICIFRFRKSSSEKHPTRRKQHRNRIYGISGVIMVVCMVIMVGLTLRSVIELRHPSRWLFWCETVALCAFGVAWLTKGEGFMRDKPRNHVRAAGHRRVVASS
jgi:UDP-N-acetylmuramyl pentapeptide phosphotransferase/UDP-N-acetylglucosamine-1-phosphate transferase